MILTYPHDAFRGQSRSSNIVCLFVCMGLNGTFSTNRIYCAITVGQSIHHVGAGDNKKYIIKQ